jgi:hypothetical protein
MAGEDERLGRRAEEEASFIRSEDFLRALKETGLIPADATFVSIRAGGDEFIRINYDHSEDGQPVATTSRLFRRFASDVAEILTALAEQTPKR